jgi:signal transduction histidine kinase
MSLQRKFAILIGLLALTVVGSLVAALVTVSIQHRQLVDPFRSMASVLTDIGRIKRNLETQERLLAAPVPVVPLTDLERVRRALANQARLVPNLPTTAGAEPEPDSAPAIERFRRAADDTAVRLRALNQSEISLNRAGKSTVRNLDQRVREFNSVAIAWFAADDQGARRLASARRYELHELIERVERRILEDQATAADYGDAMRQRLGWVLVLALGTAILVAVLTLILVRRWVVRPVAALRAATERLGSGDFSHRVVVDPSAGDELAQLSHEVNGMASQIVRMQDERVERERLAAIGEMVRRLAHNLRNPLAGIRALAELTAGELGPESNLHENQTRIIQSIDRFEKWLSDLLRVTRPLAISPEPCKVRPLLAGVIDAHRPMAQSKNIDLELDDSQMPEEAVFDPRHLEHTIVAIVTNAIQASPPGSKVRIAARRASDQEWEISVADQGPGVPPELLDRIFNAYFTTKRDGSGIGLAIAQQVVRAHGGRITVEKGLGDADRNGTSASGATFVVRLPLTQSDQSEASTPSDVPVRSEETARFRRTGAQGGENFDHRGRRERPVLDSTKTDQGRA